MIRHPARFAFPALLFVLCVAACGAQSQASGGGGSSSNRNALSSEEMLRAGYPDAFATVQSLRPQWLQRRGANSRAQSIKVYLDGSLLGGPELLRQITTRSIGSIRYMTPLEASERYGLDHDLGAIIVTTRRS
jgi:hypothetical protein